MEKYIRDSLTRIQCPPEVLAFIERHESYSLSGNESKGEGGDFVLEAKNRETKRLVPSGVPTNQIWTNNFLPNEMKIILKHCINLL